MGANWRTATTLIITALQIPGLISVQTTSVSAVEGQRFYFKCKYKDGMQNNSKYFCYDGEDKLTTLIRTGKHNEWDHNGRFAIYDNTKEAEFTVRVETLTMEDSGTYQCGVDVNLLPDFLSFIVLNVSRETVSEDLTYPPTESPVIPYEPTMKKTHLSLFVTAAMCLAAILFICLFTLCLLLAVKNRRPPSPQQRQMSSDYEIMMSRMTTEPELSCSLSEIDTTDFSALPPPLPDHRSKRASKHLKSEVTLSPANYIIADEPKSISDYQNLDISVLEEHVYCSLYPNEPKDRPRGDLNDRIISGC